MRRFTQRRDAGSGQRYTQAEDIRMPALEALLPEELERHCQLQWSRLDKYRKLREEVVLHAEASGYVAPKLCQVAKAREDRDDPMDVGFPGNALAKCRLSLRAWVSKKPMLCLHPVTDEEGRPLDDEDESGTRLCTYWGRIFEARSEDERHHAYETILGFVHTAPKDIQWTIDKQELKC